MRTPRSTLWLTLAVLCTLAGVAVWLFSGPARHPLAPAGHDPATEAGFDPTAPIAAELDAAERTSVAPGPASQNVASRGETTLDARLLLSGRVVDPSGAPVAGAAIALRARESMRAVFERGGPREFGDFRARFRPRELERTRSGSDGRFAIRASTFAESSLEVAVQCQGFAPAVVDREWAVADGEVALPDIVLDQGGTIVGAVVDEAGRAIAAARVEYRRDGGGGGRPGGRGGRGRGDFGGEDTLEAMIPAVVTDAAGTFRFEHVPAGSFRANARAEQREERSSGRHDVPAPADEVAARTIDVGSIRLGPAATLLGIVLGRGGEPLAEAEVEATPLRNADTREEQGRRRGPGTNERAASQRTTTDAAGRFALDHLPLGEVRVRASHPRHLDAEQEPVVIPPPALLELRLDPRLVASGTVIDRRTGQPVTEFGIRARRADGPGFLRGLGRGGDEGGRNGDGRGRFGDGRPMEARVAEVRGGEIRRDGGRDGGRAREVGARVAEWLGGDGVDDESRRAEIEQRIASIEQSEAARRAWLVERLGPAGTVPQETPPPTEHADGRFTVADLEPGDYVFDVDAPGYVRAAHGPVTVVRGQEPAGVVVAVETGTPVRGTVVDAKDRAPVADARVRIELPDPPGTASNGGLEELFGQFGRRGGRSPVLAEVRTDASGSFALTPLRAGRYRVVIEASGFETSRDDAFQVRSDGAVQSAEFAIVRGTRVFGTVRGLPPGTAADVVFRHVDGTRRTSRASAETGEYDLEGLPAGGYFVSVETRDGEGWRRRAASLLSQGDPDLFLAAGTEHRYDPPFVDPSLAVVRGTVRIDQAFAEGVQITLESDSPAPIDEAGPRGGFGRMRGAMLRDDSDAAGRWEIAGVPPGAYVLVVRSRGRGGAELHREPVQVGYGAEVERHLDFAVGRVELSITGPDGQPVARGRVELVLLSESGEDPATWRELPSHRSIGIDRGTARGDVPAGVYRYVVRSNGMSNATGTVDATAVSGAPPTVVRLTQAPADGGQR